MPTQNARIAALDLARGIAVLGILTMNVVTFAGPSVAGGLPAFNESASQADRIAFALGWVFLDGKMRAVFTLLFGAGLVLFVERAKARGANGYWLQARRLFWLAIFGYAHFLFLWRGDILLLYAVAGALVLPLVSFRTEQLIALGLAALIAGFLALLAMASINLTGEVLGADAFDFTVEGRALAQMRENAMGFAEAVSFRLSERPFYPLELLSITLFEAIPLMFLGMAMAKSGVLSAGRLDPRVRRLALGAVLCGTIWSAASLAWHTRTGWSLTGASLMPYYTDLPARAAMGLGALLLIADRAETIVDTRIGRRLVAAGRMAFSNYLLTSLVMTALFFGWGMNLGALGIGRAEQWLFVIGGWAAMLIWSAPWLKRFGVGPLEAMWKGLR